MKFAFETEQLALADGVARFLEKESAPDGMRTLWDDATGRSPRVWEGLTGIGLPGILVPEEFGGAGGDLLDLIPVLEQVGRSCVPDALLEAFVLGPAALTLAGSHEQQREWLPDIATGAKRVAVALHGLESVADVHVADVLVLVSDGTLAIARREHLQLTALSAVDPARRQFRVEVAAHAIEPLPGGTAALPQLLALESVGSAAVLVGLSQQMLDLTVDYAKVRQQFGRPIGSFQAVKHQLAGAVSYVGLARLAVHASAWRVAARAEDAEAAARLSRICALDAEFEANRVALQVHGGIGFTWEHDLQMWLKRGKALEQAHGGRHELAASAGRELVLAQQGAR